jgi:hypothetical protein
MRGAIPPLPNTPSWRGAQSTGETLPLPLLIALTLTLIPFTTLTALTITLITFTTLIALTMT